MKISKSLKGVLLVEFILPITLLILGVLQGLMQVIHRAGVIHSADIVQVGAYHVNYYQGLTLHGVVNAIVLTTFFAVAFGHAVITFYLKKEPPKFTYVLSLWLMVIGVLMDAFSMLSGRSQALFTFYPPLRDGWEFYIGTALVVVGSWVAFFGWIPLWGKYKKENPGVKMPVAVLGTYVTHTIWLICTLPVAFVVLAMLTPWTLGWMNSLNISLERTLFWMFGHPLVYFWLLPAYIMYYTVLPKLAGGKLYSVNATRFAFLLFLILSVPIGIHHQYTEPVIAQNIKLYHAILTYAVALPSFLTAFTVAASLEYAGRKRGSKTWLGWMGKLPWFQSNNFLFSYLICGLLLFIPGGLTGIVNASYSLNQVVHNTGWVPGHFHMTVAGPVFLGIVGMMLYLYAKITGKDVKCKKLATIMPYMWLFGMLFLSHGLMAGGLMGEPRRTNMGMSYTDPSSSLFNPHYVLTSTFTLIGGIIMTVAAVFYFISFFGTVFSKPVREGGLEIPVSEDLHEEHEVRAFTNMKPWVVIAIVLAIVSYAPAIIDVMSRDRVVPVENKFDPASPVNLANPANTTTLPQQ